jgi:hypothetical protein
MQGIPQVISQSNESENDRNWWKLGSLAILGILAAAASGYFLSIFLAGVEFAYFYTALGMLVVLGIILVLQAVFISSVWHLRVLTILEGLVVLPFFFSYYQDLSITAFVGSFLWLWFVVRGSLVANNLARGGMKPVFSEPARRAAAATVTGWLLLTVFMGYTRFVEQGGLTDALGQRLTKEALVSLESAFQLQFPKVSFQATTGEFLVAIGEELVTRSGAITDLGPAEYVPPQVKNQIIAEAAKKVREDLEKSLNLKLSPNEPITDAVYRSLKSFLNGFAPAFRDALAAVFMVLVFFSLRGISFLAVWLMQAVAWIFYKLFLAFGFARVASEMRSREFIVLN